VLTQLFLVLLALRVLTGWLVLLVLLVLMGGRSRTRNAVTMAAGLSHGQTGPPQTADNAAKPHRLECHDLAC
jgi:hypothetical protein